MTGKLVTTINSHLVMLITKVQQELAFYNCSHRNIFGKELPYCFLGEYIMRTIDLSPLYRSAIGFDRLASMIETGNKSNNQGYPPYNIEQFSEDEYRITLAVAGFDESELEITSHQNTLLVKGTKQPQENSESKFLYQGIAERGFERKYQLADYVTVQAADLNNGLLHIDLKREVPEAMKPRSIAISGNKRLEE